MSSPPPEYCEFCALYQQRVTNSLVIAEQDQLFAFHDLNDASAEAHVLVCTKDHIETALDIASDETLDQMRSFGRSVLASIFKSKHDR